MLAVPPRRTRHEVQQALEIAVEGQRQVFYLSLLNFPPGIGGVGLQNRVFGTHHDGFRCRARLEFQVYAHIGVHQNIDVGADGALESLLVHGNFVSPGRKIWELIVATLVCGSLPLHTRVHFRCRDLGARNHGAAGIGHRPKQGRIHRLTHDWCRKS